MLDATDVLVDGHPLVQRGRIPRGLVVGRVAVAQEVPGGVDEGVHRVGLAARGTAVIWCAPERQAALHPVSISHYLGQGFAAEFDFNGTRDSSPWLAVPKALDYLAALDPEAVYAHNNALVPEPGDDVLVIAGVTVKHGGAIGDDVVERQSQLAIDGRHRSDRRDDFLGLEQFERGHDLMPWFLG